MSVQFVSFTRLDIPAQSCEMAHKNVVCEIAVDARTFYCLSVRLSNFPPLSACVSVSLCVCVK